MGLQEQALLRRDPGTRAGSLMAESNRRSVMGNMRRPAVDTLRASLHRALDHMLDSMTYRDDGPPELTGPYRDLSQNSVQVLMESELTGATTGYHHLELRISMTPRDVWQARKDRAELTFQIAELKIKKPEGG